MTYSKELKKFKTSIEELEAWLQLHNINFPRRNHKPEPLLNPESIGQSLKNTKNLIQNLKATNEILKEEERLKIILNKAELEPVDQAVYQKLTEDLIWEIMDFNINQLYRSPAFFEKVSYPIDVLQSKSLWDLLSRPPSVIKSLIQYMERIQDAKEVIDMSEHKAYVIEESFSSSRKKFLLDHKFVCGLRKKGETEINWFLSAFTLEEIQSNNLHLFN